MRNLPKGWEWATLETICSKVTDGSHGTPKFIETGYPFVSITDIKQEGIDFSGAKRIAKSDYEKLKGNCNPRKGDVLFTKDGTVGKVIEVDFDREFVVLSSVAILRPITNHVLPKYLVYALKNKDSLSQASRTMTGTALTRIILKNLRTVRVPVPPLDTQRKIVAILDKAEETRRLRVQANELTQKLLQSVFMEMFGDPLKNSKGFPVRKLGELAEITMGQSPPGESYNCDQEGAPFLQGKAEFGPYCPTIRQYTTQPSKMAREGSILMSIRAPVGDVNMAQDDYCIGRGLASILSDKMDMTYLYYYLNEIKPYIESLGTGSTFKAISGSILRSIPIVEPPLGLQIEFHKIEARHRALIELQSFSTTNVDSISTSLTSKAFTGELVA